MPFSNQYTDPIFAALYRNIAPASDDALNRLNRLNMGVANTLGDLNANYGLHLNRSGLHWGDPDQAQKDKDALKEYLRAKAMEESDLLRARAQANPANQDVLKAMAAQQGFMAADQSRANATAPQRRSYPIDAYGSTPEERIRNVQNLNAQESNSDVIMEMQSPAEAALGNMYTMGMMGAMDPRDIAAVQGSIPGPQYNFTEDTGPQQTNADANMRRAFADESHVKYLRDELAAQQKMAPEFSLMELLKAKAQFEKSGVQNPDLDSMINTRLQQQRIEDERRQNQLRQRQRTQSSLPITGRPMTSLAEMIQHGFIS